MLEIQKSHTGIHTQQITDQIKNLQLKQTSSTNQNFQVQ